MLKDTKEQGSRKTLEKSTSVKITLTHADIEELKKDVINYIFAMLRTKEFKSLCESFVMAGRDTYIARKKKFKSSVTTLINRAFTEFIQSRRK